MVTSNTSFTPKKIFIWLGVILVASITLFNLGNIIAYFKTMFAPPPPDAGNSNVVDPTTGKKYDPNGEIPKFAVDLKAMANNIHSYVTSWRNIFYVSPQDQERIVKELLRISKPVFPYLKKEYSFLEGTRDLNADLVNSLSADRYAQISHLF